MASLSGSPALAGAPPPPPPVDAFCVDWCKAKLAALGVPEIESRWRDKDHGACAAEFLRGIGAPSRLFAYVDVETNDLVVTRDVPVAGSWKKMLAFVRDPNAWVTPASVSTAVHFACINGESVADALLAVMRGVYAPAVTSNKTWPDSLRKDLTGQMHKYMANLTERAHELKGKTTLYVPTEELPSPAAAAREKGAFYLTLVPIRPRSRGERRSLRTFAGVSLRPGSLAFNPRLRYLSTPKSDAF